MGTTPVGPLSPLFLDLRSTSILGKKKHPHRNPWDGPPPSSAWVPGLSGVGGGGGGGLNEQTILSTFKNATSSFSIITF